MSWAKDEWKQELSANALKHVFELEQRCETLQKDNKQKQFQFESVQAALDKQKKLTDEEKSNHLALKKELSSVTESCRELEQSRQKTLHDLNSKEAHARCLDGKLSRCQHNLDLENAKGMQLKNDLEHLQYEHNQIITKFEKQSADFSKSKEANNLLQRQLAGHKERVRCLESQLKSLGEEPSSRLKKSSSSSEPETDWLSDLENKLKDTQVTLHLEREQRQRLENDLKALQTNSSISNQESMATNAGEHPMTCQDNSPFENNEFIEFKENAAEIKASIEAQLKAQCKELVKLAELLQEKDMELQCKIKELNDMSESLQRKDQEMCEVKQNLLESSKTNSKLSDELSTTKSHLDQANSDLVGLERKAKQREQDMECQRHNSEAVVKGLEEKLKEREKEHREELHSQSQMIMTLEKQYHDMERKTTDLQNKLDNSQRLVESRDQDITKLKGSLSEMENLRKQQTFDLDGRIVEFERKANDEHQRYTGIKQELEEVKTKLADTETKLAELNATLEQSSCTLRAREQELCEKNKQTQQSQSAIQTELVSALEKCSLLQKEKENSELAHQNLLQRKMEECTATLNELEQQKREVIRLKEQTVHFQNLLAAKEAEKQKFEEANAGLSEKLQKVEKDMTASCDEWKAEKELFVEKERSLQSSMEAMKNDSKALQHDYKKACDLADLKSAETREIIDKLEASQKHAHELQLRMNRAEAALKEREETLNELTLKRDELLKQLAQKDENAERKEEEFNQMCSARKNEIESLKGTVDSMKIQLNKSINECMERDKEVEALTAKMRSAESLCGDLQHSLKDAEEKLENSRGLVDQKDAQYHEIIAEIATKEKMIWELQQKQIEIQSCLSETEQKKSSLQLAKEENMRILRSKDEEIASLMKELSEIKGITDRKIAEMKEQCTASQNEMVFLQEKLANQDALLQNKNAEVESVNLELQDQRNKVIELERRLTAKEESSIKCEEEIVELNRKLGQNGSALVEKKRELEDVRDKFATLETERGSCLEEYQNQIKQLKTDQECLKAKLEQANTVAESKTEQLNVTLTQLTSMEEERTELTAMLDELCNTNAALEEQIAEKARMVGQASEALKSKEGELSLQRKTAEKLQTASDMQVTTLKKRCSAVESEASSLQEKCNHLEACSKSKENELISATARIQELCVEVSELQELVASKKAIIDCKDREKDILTEEMRFKVTALENKERELKQMTESFQEIKSNRQSAQEEIFAEAEELKKEVICLREKLDQSAVAIEMKDQDVESISEQFQAMEEEKVQLGDKCDELASKNAALQEKIVELQQNEGHLSELLKKKEGVLLAKCSELDDLQTASKRRICELEERCSLQGRQVAELEDKCSQLEACFQNKSAELNGFANREKGVSEELQRLQDLLTVKDEFIKGAEEELKDLRQRLEQQLTVLESKEHELRQVSELLEQEKNKEQSNLEKLAMEAEKFKNEAGVLSEKWNNLKIVLEVKDKELISKMEQLESTELEKATLRTKLDELTCRFEAMEGNTATVTSRMQHLSEMLGNKEKELLNKCKEMEKFETETAKKMWELKEQCSVQESQVALLQEKCSQLESLIENKQTEYESSTNKLQELTSELSELREILASKEEMAGSEKQEKENLWNKLEHTSSALCNKEKQLNELSELLKEERNKQATQSETYFSETETLKERVVTLTEKVEKLSEVVDVRNQEITSLIQRLKSTEEEKAELSVKVDELTNSGINMQGQNRDLKNKLVQISEALQANQDLLTEKCKVIEDLQTVGSEEVSQLKELDSVQKSQILSLHEKCTSLESCLEGKNAELDNLRAEVQSLKDAVINLQDILQTKEQVAIEKEGSNLELDGKLQQANKVIENMKQEHISASNMMQQLFDEKDVEIEKQVKLAEGLTMEVASLTEKLAKLDATSEVKDNNLTAMLQEIRSAEEEKANLENKLDEMRDLHASLQENLAESVSKNEQLSEIFKVKDEELLARKQDVERLNKLLEGYSEKATTEFSDLQEENSSLSTELRRSKDLLQSKEMEVERVNSEVEFTKKECEVLKKELAEKATLLLETEEKFSGVLSDKESLSSLIEAKEKALLCLMETQETEMKHKEKLTDELSSLTEKCYAQVATIQALSEEKSNLVSAVEKLQEQIEELSEAKNHLGQEAETEAVKLEEQVKRFEAELKTKESVEQDLLSKLSHKDTLLEEANKLVGEQREEIRQLSAHKEMLQMDSEDKDSYIASLDQKVGRLDSAAEELKQKLQAKEELNKSLAGQLESVTKQLEESLRNEKDKEGYVMELTRNFETSQARVEIETGRNEKLKEEIELLQGKMEHTLAWYEKSVTELDGLKEANIAGDDKISKLSSELRESKERISALNNEKIKLEELLRSSEKKLEEGNMVIEKEKENVLLERNKILREKTEEYSAALEKLERSSKEEARLKDLIVHLENISAAKDQEKEKFEMSVEAFNEKRQKREEELLTKCEVLEKEKTSLLEKTREMQATMETLRLEYKTMQQDCKKACELADSKSQAYRDAIDQLDDSQKHLQETCVKLSRAETELKESAEELLQARKEKNEVLQQMSFEKETFELNDQRLRNEIKSGEENVSKLSSQLRDREVTIRRLEIEKEEAEQMLKHAKEELWKAEEELQTCAGDVVSREVLLKHEEESSKVEKLFQEQIKQLELSKSEVASDLENARKEICSLKDNSQATEVQNAVVIAAKESELQAQNTKICELQHCHAEAMEKLQKVIESGEMKDQETQAKIEVLLAEKHKLLSEVDEKGTELNHLMHRNKELESTNEELKKAVACLEERLAKQQNQMAELSGKNRKLEEDLSATAMQLGLIRKQVEEKEEKLEKNQGQNNEEVEKLQSLLSARCSQVEKLQRNLSEQTEILETLKSEVSCLSEELESLRTEHRECTRKGEASSTLRDQVLELEHLLSREKSNTQALMQAFQEQEQQWEEEKARILSSSKSDGENKNQHLVISEENAQLKRKLHETQNDLKAKAEEHAKALLLIEKRASRTSSAESELHARVKELTSECEELRYSVKQKEEDIFVKKELLKQKDQTVQSLESKYAAAEDVERELRHHLGELTQQLEWSKESCPARTDNQENKADYEDIKKELNILKTERKDRDKEIEEERVRIVEAAKGFALQQEEKFGKKIHNLELQITSKDEELQEAVSELKQLRHKLQTLQQEKDVLLEAGEEREQEFDAEKRRWNSGDYSYEKIQQYLEDLEEERRRVTVLQESCAELQDKLNRQESCNSNLQKKLGELQSEQRHQDEERETREDDLYNEVDTLRSESKKLKEEVQNEKTIIANLASEKAELLAKLESLEKELKESMGVATELQQECDMLKDQLEGLKKENDRLLNENDVTVLSKNQEKLNFEDANRRLQELKGQLEKEVKDKTELSETVKILENRLASLLKKYQELEEKMNNLDQEKKQIAEEKEKELVKIQDKLKKAEEKMVEMSEDHQLELDSVRFTLYSAKDECTALQEENEELKRNMGGRSDQRRWIKEKQSLVQQLDEATIRYEQANRNREDLECRLNALNVKIISLESKSAPSKNGENEDAAAEIEGLRIKVKKIAKELEQEKKRADEKEKEANEMLESNFQLVKKQKKIVREKESLESRFKIACEKLSSMKTGKAKESAVHGDGESSNNSRVPAKTAETRLAPKLSPPASIRPIATEAVSSSSTTTSNPVVLLSPLARSLSNLEIRPVTTNVTAGRTKAETTASSAASQMSCQSSTVLPKPQLRSMETERSKEPLSGSGANNLSQGTKGVQGLAARNTIPRPGMSTDNLESKKRVIGPAVNTNPVKRCRVTSGGDSVDIPASQELPEGLPEVVSKGFADIPAPPIKSPFILRRTTAPVFASGVRTRQQTKRGAKRSALPTASYSRVASVPKENPVTAYSPPRGQTAPPEMALSPRKTNIMNVPQAPQTKIPKFGSQVPRPSRPKAASGSTRAQPSRRARAVPVSESEAGTAENNQKECKMQ